MAYVEPIRAGDCADRGKSGVQHEKTLERSVYSKIPDNIAIKRFYPIQNQYTSGPRGDVPVGSSKRVESLRL